MADLATLKLVHQLSALFSISGFALRGFLMMRKPALLRRRWMRTWPHFIDTLLLVSCVWMAFLLHLHPGNSAWLAAKLVALLAYIGLGFVALRLGSSRRQRVAALIAALACFAYIGAVAMRKSVIPL